MRCVNRKRNIVICFTISSLKFVLFSWHEKNNSMIYLIKMQPINLKRNFTNMTRISQLNLFKWHHSFRIKYRNVKKMINSEIIHFDAVCFLLCDKFHLRNVGVEMSHLSHKCVFLAYGVHVLKHVSWNTNLWIVIKLYWNTNL